MQIILTKQVRNLGNVGDVVTVKPGFGRNYLLPKQMAVRATKENLTVFEQRREEFEKAEQQLLSLAQERAEQLQAIIVVLAAQASHEGKLYGAIHAREVAQAITAAGVQVEKQEIQLLQGPIRYLGEYAVKIILHPQVEVTLTLGVVEKK